MNRVSSIVNVNIDGADRSLEHRPLQERAELRAKRSAGALEAAARGCAASGFSLTHVYKAIGTITR